MSSLFRVSHSLPPSSWRAHVCALSDIALDLSQYKRLRFPLLYGEPASKKRRFVTPLYIPSQLHSIWRSEYHCPPILFAVIRMRSVLFLHFCILRSILHYWYIILIYFYTFLLAVAIYESQRGSTRWKFDEDSHTRDWDWGDLRKCQRVAIKGQTLRFCRRR